MTEREFECIQHQLSSLRRENRFLKVGLILCFVFASLPYLTGFQPEVIRAKKVVIEGMEFVRDGRTVMSVTVRPELNELVIQDANKLPLVSFSRRLFGFGGSIGVYNNKGKIVASMEASLLGGSVSIFNNNLMPVVSIDTSMDGGSVSVYNNKFRVVALMDATEDGGAIDIFNNKEKTAVSMKSSTDGGLVGFCNNDGKLVALMGSSAYGGVVGVCDREGKPAATMEASPLFGKIALLAPSGRTIWSAP